ncbi:hypothetical protein ABEV34_19275 [Methylorubrum rhodesianum]|uniref:hypothetical protein n=1 Tax=Methylorubrum rhodesianum TaxID=29427 RepID=UPI003D277746
MPALRLQHWSANGHPQRLPRGQRYADKDETQGIERDNARQWNSLARFRHRSIVVSKTKRMVDVSLALFARFAGNSRIIGLLPMLAYALVRAGDLGTDSWCGSGIGVQGKHQRASRLKSAGASRQSAKRTPRSPDGPDHDNAPLPNMSH